MYNDAPLRCLCLRDTYMNSATTLERHDFGESVAEARCDQLSLARYERRATRLHDLFQTQNIKIHFAIWGNASTK